MGDQESPKDRGRCTSAGDGLKGQEVGAPLTPQLGALGVTVSSGGRRMTTGSSPRPQHLRLSQMSPCLGALVTGRQPRVGGAPFVCPPFLLREHFLLWQPVFLFGPSPTTLYLHPIQPY